MRPEANAPNPASRIEKSFLRRGAPTPPLREHPRSWCPPEATPRSRRNPRFRPGVSAVLLLDERESAAREPIVGWRTAARKLGPSLTPSSLV